MKILFSADWHVKLGQDKVPKQFQKNRFLRLADRLDEIYKEHNCDLHIIGGDILDVADPSTEELELMYACLSIMKQQKGMIYTGNHEMLSKTISCLSHLADNIKEASQGNWEVVGSIRSPEFDIVDYVELKKAKWKPAQSKLCFSHVRGEIPPHVTFEVEPELFKEWGLVVCGDLHSYKNTQTVGDTIFAYPGSPLTTSFHRERTVKTNGAFIVDTDTLELTWIELGDLPQLIRKTITSPDDMVEDAYDRVIYEVTGNVEELRKVKDSELLDKRLNNKVTKDAKLDLTDKTHEEELAIYLEEVQGIEKSSIPRLVSLALEIKKTCQTS
ncbi:exonuclease subunit 1 [Serratia phage Slocum]|nr:exonuclease subunit 1 [Serratia phage Slocum]